MRATFFLVLFFGSTSLADVFGQSPDLWWVVGNNGRFAQHAATGTSLHYTLGEIMVARFANGGAQLTQGYHQVLYQITPVEETPYPDWQLHIFPNPTTGLITIRTAQTLDGHLFDATGREILRLSPTEGDTHADLSRLPAGHYVLRLSEPDGPQARSFFIQVVH